MDMDAVFLVIAILEFVLLIFSFFVYVYRYKVNFFNFLQESKLLLITQLILPFVGIAVLNYIVLDYSESGIIAIFEAIGNTFNLITFNFSNEILLEHLSYDMMELICFSIAYCCFIFAFYFSVIVTFFEKWINIFRNKTRVLKAKRKNCDILIGTKDIKPYIQNYLQKKNNNYSVVVWSNNLTEEDMRWLFSLEIPVIKKSFTYAELIKEKFYYNNTNLYNFISFDDEAVNIKYVSEFIKFISSQIPSILFDEVSIYKLEKFYLHIEIGLENIVTIQNKILSYRDVNGAVTVSPFIHFFNRYELTSISFNEKYPITKYMPTGFVDTTKCAIINDSKNIIKPFDISINNVTIEVESMFSKMINVIYLGFGKVSRELYRSSVMNNQIPSYEEVYIDGKLEKINLKNHLINYFAFDKETLDLGDKNNIYYVNRINSHLFYRENLKYFSPVDKTHNFYACNCDINFDEILDDIARIVDNDNNKYSSIIISLGDDLDNIDYALKINLLLQQLGVSNYHIFVRVKNQTPEIVKYLNNNFTFFGSDSAVLNHNVIINDNLNTLAHILDKEYNLKKLSKDSWFAKDSIKHKSSIYSALNLRLKLHLLGYDYVLKTNSLHKKVSHEEFVKKIAKKGNDYNEYLFFNKINEYSCTEILSYQEHLRWNAFYIFNGYIPMSYSNLSYHDGRFYKDDNNLKTHMCLIPYEELDKYHKLLALVKLMIIQLEEKNTEDLDLLYSLGISDELIEITSKVGFKDEKGNEILLNPLLVEIISNDNKINLLFKNERFIDLLNNLQTYKYDYNLVDNFEKIFFKRDIYKLIKK